MRRAARRGADPAAVAVPGRARAGGWRAGAVRRPGAARGRARSAFPIGIGIAMLRHRLFDVELTLNRTLVFGAPDRLRGRGLRRCGLRRPGRARPARAGASCSWRSPRWSPRPAATGCRRCVDRTLFGHRHNPYAVVARVGRRVAAASAAGRRAAAAGRRAARRAAAALRRRSPAATSRRVRRPGARQPGGRRSRRWARPVGELHVGLRAPGEKWSAGAAAAIDEVAARAGTLAYAADLVADVARSRERIVAAREEERRRLRADLHDGVAPALAGTALQLESLARRLSAGEDELAERAPGPARRAARRRSPSCAPSCTGCGRRSWTSSASAGALRQLVAGHETPRCTVRGRAARRAARGGRGGGVRDRGGGVRQRAAAQRREPHPRRRRAVRR